MPNFFANPDGANLPCFARHCDIVMNFHRFKSPWTAKGNERHDFGPIMTALPCWLEIRHFFFAGQFPEQLGNHEKPKKKSHVITP